MKYICFLYYDTQKLAALSPAEAGALGPACQPYDEAVRAQGAAVVVHASLASPEEGKCIRPVQGRPTVSAGPYLNISEQVGAFLIVDAGDMDEAVRIASNHAAANVGEHIGFGVEVRACQSYD
jgi:hypothetical protein